MATTMDGEMARKVRNGSDGARWDRDRHGTLLPAVSALPARGGEGRHDMRSTEKMSSGDGSSEGRGEKAGSASKRDSLPSVFSNRGKPGNVDKDTLKVLMGQGGQEMDECVQEGKFPIFGYPLVCYSPIGKPKRERGEFWGHLFRSTMKSNKQAISLIGELLDSAEEFDLKEKEL